MAFFTGKIGREPHPPCTSVLIWEREICCGDVVYFFARIDLKEPKFAENDKKEGRYGISPLGLRFPSRACYWKADCDKID
jgi:hypothetical protein